MHVSVCLIIRSWVEQMRSDQWKEVNGYWDRNGLGENVISGRYRSLGGSSVMNRRKQKNYQSLFRSGSLPDMDFSKNFPHYRQGKHCINLLPLFCITLLIKKNVVWIEKDICWHLSNMYTFYFKVSVSFVVIVLLGLLRFRFFFFI